MSQPIATSTTPVIAPTPLNLFNPVKPSSHQRYGLQPVIEGPVRVFLVDDHLLLRDGIRRLVEQMDGYEVCGQASSGTEFVRLVMQGNVPHLVLLDLNMPLMNGEETAMWLKSHHPQVRIIALSMYDDDRHVIRMIRAGASGYLLKNISPAELHTALDQVRSGVFYCNQFVTMAMHKNIVSDPDDVAKLYSLHERHLEFLRLCATELTYKEIAHRMNLSVRTVDGYRDELFDRLKVRSRIGLVLFALRNGLADVEGGN